MTNTRLPISFALALCTGVALFGLLRMLISVDRDELPVIICTVPGIEFRPVVRTICACGERARPRVKPVLERPRLPPDPPPIVIHPFVFVYGDESSVQFDLEWEPPLGASRVAL